MKFKSNNQKVPETNYDLELLREQVCSKPTSRLSSPVSKPRRRAFSTARKPRSTPSAPSARASASWGYATTTLDLRARQEQALRVVRPHPGQGRSREGRVRQGRKDAFESPWKVSPTTLRHLHGLFCRRFNFNTATKIKAVISVPANITRFQRAETMPAGRWRASM